MNAKKILLVFRHDTTESETPVLVPIKVPEGITLEKVEEWLPTLEKHHGYSYTVMLTSFVCDYDIKEQKTLYAESVAKPTRISVGMVYDTTD